MNNTSKIIEFVEKELAGYRKNKSIYESIKNENNISLSASMISDIPKTITNKFSSMTENQAIINRLGDLEKEIRRVDIWINSLQDEEKFVVTNIYLEGKSYHVLANKWNLSGNPYFSVSYWKKKRKYAIKYICEIFASSFINNIAPN
jgi:ArpU family phage transcriptional regulator